MPKISAGLLMYRRKSSGPEVFLVHPGGPFFKNETPRPPLRFRRGFFQKRAFGELLFEPRLSSEFKNKDEGFWSIPKGELHNSEDILEAAKREFAEETGIIVPDSVAFAPLGAVTQTNGKVVYAWGWENDLPGEFIFKSNTFTLEWPPRSGKLQEFPENDRGEFFNLETAARKINPPQKEFLRRFDKST